MKSKLYASLAVSALALGLAFSGNATAGYIFDFKPTCSVGVGDGCAGDPESENFKVTITKDEDSNTDSFTIDWIVHEGTQADGYVALPVDLKASSTWTVLSFDTGKLEIKIDITNDTILPEGSNNANILSFGFGVDPNSTATFVKEGDNFNSLGTNGNNQNFPGGFKDIDVCAFTSNNCNGGNVNDGLAARASDSLTLAITPDSDSVTYGNSIDLLFFPLKFQGTWGSFEPAGFPSQNGGGISELPEPATLGLLGIGLFGLGMATYRRRRLASTEV